MRMLLNVSIKFLSIPRTSLNNVGFENALRQTLPIVLALAPSDLGMSTLRPNLSYIFILTKVYQVAISVKRDIFKSAYLFSGQLGAANFFCC